MLHTRTRWLIVAVALAATLATTLLAGPALRSTLAASGLPSPYLALGDSVAFGYSSLVDPSDPHNFSGYPTPAARALKESLTNAACPGETSTHFVDLAGSDNGCGAFRAKYPLHVAYSSATQTQLEFADAFLQAHPTTQLVSITIGANDLFVLEKNCGGNVGCIEAGLPGMLQTLAKNLTTIYSHIRTLDGYHNQLVALTYYSLNYSDNTGTYVISQVNGVVAQATQAAGGIVADGFGAFEAIASPAPYNGDTCAAGLRIVLPPPQTGCDLHPSYPGDNGLESHADTGRDVLGQAIVNALPTA